MLHGPKENCEVICITPTGSFSFGELAPSGTRFRVRYLRQIYDGFSANMDVSPVVTIPGSRRHERETVWSLLHEVGHCWNNVESGWNDEVKHALDTFTEVSTMRKYSFPKEFLEKHYTKEKYSQSLEIIGREEKRASGLACYFIGTLRKQGIDPFPDRPDISQIAELANERLATYEMYGLSFQLDIDRIESWLEGERPTA